MNKLKDKKRAQAMARKAFLNDMAKQFSDIEALLSLNGEKKNEIDFNAISAARSAAHKAWKELVENHGASPAA